jgi:hypothetical protein
VVVAYELVEGFAVLIVAGFLLVLRMAPALARRLTTAGSSADAEGASHRLRVASAAVLAAIVVAALGLRYVGLPLAPSDQPLQFGKSYEVGGPNLLARVAGDPGSDEFDFAYAPGAEIRSGITLQNTGGLPLSVTGVIEDSTPYVSSVELRLPADPISSNAELDSAANNPFHSFTIPAHGEASLALVVTIGRCASIPSTPTQATGDSTAAADDHGPALGGALTSLSTIRLGYTVLGMARIATVRLPFRLVAIGPPGTGGCPTG